MSLIEQARGNLDRAEGWLEKAWQMVADLSPSKLRTDVGTLYIRLLVTRKKDAKASAVREQL